MKQITLNPIALDGTRLEPLTLRVNCTFKASGEHVALTLNSNTEAFQAILLEQGANGSGVLEIKGCRVPYYTCEIPQPSGASIIQVWLAGQVYSFEKPAAGKRRRSGATSAAEASGEVKAPMPGKVLELKVALGDAVEPGQTVVVMESMKMEMTLTATTTGTVKSILCESNDMVEMGAVLIQLNIAEAKMNG